MTSSRTDAHPLEAFGAVGHHVFLALEGDRLASSYLLEGADPDVLGEAAQVIAASILASTPPGPARGRSFELAMSGRHPDLHRLERDKATVISVAALTATLERAHAKPLEGERQVFIIDPADAMEPEGVARYLKSLEEPPAGTVFLLVTTHADGLPSTVLSRCARLRLPPSTASQIEARLLRDDVDPDTASRAARASAGSFARARRIASAELLDLSDAILRAATEEPAGVARVTNAVRSALEAKAKERAAEEGEGRGREAVRNLLDDLIFIVAVEARECAAGRANDIGDRMSPAESIHLLASLGELTVAIRRNVAPAVILLELTSHLRGV